MDAVSFTPFTIPSPHFPGCIDDVHPDLTPLACSLLPPPATPPRATGPRQVRFDRIEARLYTRKSSIPILRLPEVSIVHWDMCPRMCVFKALGRGVKGLWGRLKRERREERVLRFFVEEDREWCPGVRFEV